MLSESTLVIVWGTALVLMLVMLALFAWACAWMAREVFRPGARPSPAPSTQLLADVEHDPPTADRRPSWDEDDAWYLKPSVMHFNPATGLPIIEGTGDVGGMGGIDVGGNPWGTSWSED